MDKQPSSRDNKKISIRKHLPLAVRVHYDVVRNFSLVKLAGVGVMALIAVFGVLLATQTLSPQSSASTNGTGSQLCAPASAPSQANEPSEYTLCAPTSLTMEQLGSEAEVTLVNTAYSPWVVGYAVGNDENCDEDFYYNVMLPAHNNLESPGYGRHQVGFEHSFAETAGDWPHYQGDKLESWGVAWESDNNKKFKFKYPIMGSGDSYDNDFDQAVYGKYLCMTITYADNNIQFKTYKRFDLLYVEMTSKTQTDLGTTYQFTSNRNARWAQGSASGLDCDLEVDDSSQTATSFTLEANGRSHLYRRCVKAKDVNNVESSVVFFVSEADGDPTKREELDDNNQQQEEVEEEDEVVEEEDEEEVVEEDDNNQQQQVVEEEEEQQNDNSNTKQDMSGEQNNPDQQTLQQQTIDNDPNDDDSTGSSGSEVTILSRQAVANTQSNTQSPADTGGTGNIPNTGVFDDQQDWSRLAGYILIGAAVLGAARVMVIKKYKKAGR